MSRTARSLESPAESAPATAPRAAGITSEEQPTRPLPKLTLFDLVQEARRLDAAMDEDRTVTIGAEENKKLLASVLALGQAQPEQAQARDDHPANDEEPTLDAPAPVTSAGLSSEPTSPPPVRFPVRPPAPHMLVITRPAPKSSPRPEAVITASAVPQTLPRSVPSFVMAVSEMPALPASLVTPPSGLRRRITPELAQAARDQREAEERRRAGTTFSVRVPKSRMQTFLVAGIWAMALSLLAVLMFMTSST